MERWRVKASRYTPTWFHACEVTFIDAEDAHEAKRIVESASVPENEVRVWAVTPATPEMEQHYQDWLNRCAEWRGYVARGEVPPKGLMSRGHRG